MTHTTTRAQFISMAALARETGDLTQAARYMLKSKTAPEACGCESCTPIMAEMDMAHGSTAIVYRGHDGEIYTRVDRGEVKGRTTIHNATCPPFVAWTVQMMSGQAPHDDYPRVTLAH